MTPSMAAVGPAWRRWPSGRRALAAVAVIAIAAIFAACGTISRTPPAPTPADFPGLAAILTGSGIQVTNIVSGDAGCADANLAKTAIGFDASGADQAKPVRVHIFIFRNKSAYTKERAAVDTCAASFVTNPDTFEVLDASPFVVAGQGPWTTGFRERLRAALVAGAGTGG